MKQGLSIDERYRYWRWHLMWAMYIGYAGFYFTRKSFNYAMPALLTDLQIEKSEIGLIATLFYATYGISKFISGIISDRSNPRFFMATGLMITALANLLFGLSSSLWLLTLLWIINAWFQGWGWPPCAKLLTHWYARGERGLWWSIWNTAHNTSGAFIALLASFLTFYYSWRETFIWSGIIALIIAVLLFYRLRDTPEKMNLPSVGEWQNDPLQIIQEQQGKGLSWKAILLQYVLMNKYIWLLALSYCLVYLVRTAINDWGNLYLTEKYHYDLLTANSTLLLFEVGGLAGSLAAGLGSDRLFRGNRGAMAFIFAMGIFLSITAFWLMPAELLGEKGYIVQGLLFFAMGFFIFGPQMLIGMAAAECSHQQSAGSATGFVGLFAYLGAAMAGYPLSLILEKFHWGGFFSVIALCASVIALLLLPFLRLQSDDAI